ncbi:MAG: energy transducer TonB [Verrucomicrobiota bacterium]|nr:energy transducer TonB [Verrucomicrobiota bacterium]MEC8332749.1 energy transducer TonB [Verrucomicrobiota bacterium]
MSLLLPSKRECSSTRLSLLYGCGAALFVMLLVPLTQIMQPFPNSVESIEEANIAPLPPPPPLEDPPPPPPKEEPPPLDLEIPPPMPNLDQLEVSLNPGTGDLSIGAGLGIKVDFSAESAEQLEQIFDFGDLDEIPRIIREGRFRYPPNSPRGQGEAFVRVLVHIDKDGRVKLKKVADFSHGEFVNAVTSMAEDSRFTSPMRNGKTVRSKYEWTIRIPFR